MPKKTDTRERVFHAADQLLAEGVRPTQQNVRERIGTGSLSTINVALNDWWRHLSERLERRNQHPELPEAVTIAASKLWDQALAYAHHALEQDRAKLARQTTENNEQIDALRQSIDALQQQNIRLGVQLDESRNALHENERLVTTHERSIIQLSSERDELRRALRQADIISNRSEEATSSSQRLLDAKVEAKVFSNRISELEALLEQKDTECEQLKQQLTKQERDSLKQVHRLELVIAQQDARYEHVLGLLNDCKADLSLAQKTS